MQTTEYSFSYLGFAISDMLQKYKVFFQRLWCAIVHTEQEQFFNKAVQYDSNDSDSVL